MNSNIQTVMSVPTIRTYEANCDGISYEVFQVLDSTEGIFRVYDVEGSSLLNLVKFPRYLQAVGAFNKATEFFESHDDWADNDPYDYYEAIALRRLDIQLGK